MNEPAPQTVAWSGRTWTLPKPNLRTQTAFEKFLERNALGGIVAQAAILGDNGLTTAVQAVSRDIAAGVYRWGRPQWAACMADDGNLTYLLWLTFTQQSDQQLLKYLRGDAATKELYMSDFIKACRDELIVKLNVLTAENDSIRQLAEEQLAEWTEIQSAKTSPAPAAA